MSECRGATLRGSDGKNLEMQHGACESLPIIMKQLIKAQTTRAISNEHLQHFKHDSQNLVENLVFCKN